jgi:hypothetical protein
MYFGFAAEAAPTKTAPASGTIIDFNLTRIGIMAAMRAHPS